MSVAAVAVGWGQYFNELLDTVFGLQLPDALAAPPGEGGSFNLPAVFLVLSVTALLIVGVRETARANTVMVVIKLAIVVLFIALAVTGFDSGNLSPFAPNGFDGVVTAGSVVFFAYIGFDAISTSGEETSGRGGTCPIAIIGSLAVCTLLYILVSLTASAALPYDQIAGQEAPLAEVLRALGFDWGATVISFGALIAITSVVLTILYGQTRIMFAMCRDGLLPRGFAKVSERRRTPVRITATFGILIALVAAFVPLTEIVKLVNIGTLFAFVIVNIGVIVLRRTRPDLQRGFRVPLVPLFPLIGAGLAIFLMKYLERPTWERFIAWLILGLIIYFAYGRRHSRLRQGDVVNPEAQLDEGRSSAPVRRALLALAASLPAWPAVAEGAAAELSVTDRLDDRRFAAVGTRAYEVGTEAGRYPAMGFHTRGEMGGIWAPPIKLLDGVWFGIDGEWLGPAQRFTSGAGHVRMELPGPAG